MKIGLKFSMKSYLKFSSKHVVWDKGRWGGGDDPTKKDGSALETHPGRGSAFFIVLGNFYALSCVFL